MPAALPLRRACWTLIVACACTPPGGDGLRGTTRLCAAAAGTALEQPCYRQCAALPASCTVSARLSDGTAALVECARDPVSGDYVVTLGAFTLPVGASTCFALLQDAGATPAVEDDLPAACVDLGSNVALTLVGELQEGACYDLDCVTAPDSACGGSGSSS